MVTYTQNVGGTDYTIDVKTDWASADYLNFADFNRLETNTTVLRNYLLAISYAIPSLSIVTNRDETYIELLSGINRIESNVETVRTNFFTPIDYGGMETWIVGKGFDYADQNRLEDNVLKLFLTAGAVYESYLYCGTINCGYTRGDLVAL